MSDYEVKVPDIGDFDDVPVVDVLISVGDEISADDPLVTLESDKSSMDVPSPESGVVEEVAIDVGEKVSAGDLICKLSGVEGADGGDKGDSGDDADEKAESGDGEEPGEGTSGDDGDDAGDSGEAEEASTDESGGEADSDSGDGGDDAGDASADDTPAEDVGRVVVIGSGPGGYTAAFRAADLGLEVVLVERYETIGGVCLNVGCIPSKALLHAAEVLAHASEAADFGIDFGEPEIDSARLNEWKGEVVDKLTGGLAGMAKKRKVKVVTGEAKFTGPNEIDVDGTKIEFTHCIIAAGSRPFELPDMPEDDRIVTSTGALQVEDLPERMLVIGGGIIGLEMACVYDALGVKVSVVEMTDELIPDCDRDLVKPLEKRISDRYEAIMVSTKVSEVTETDKGLEVTFEGDGAPEPQVYDRVLAAAGRRANGDRLELGESGVEVNDDGTIDVDETQRTNVSHIFAIGDIVGEPMLAHKATYEGVIAAEVIAGEDVVYDARTIPAVAYTDPEIAWTGLTEVEAKEEGTDYEVGKFPWQASGRALSIGRPNGLTKIVHDPADGRILGAGIVGPSAGELIAELALAIEMGAYIEDVGLTIHPHPTLSETVSFAAEVAEGVATDIYAPKG